MPRGGYHSRILAACIDMAVPPKLNMNPGFTVAAGIDILDVFIANLASKLRWTLGTVAGANNEPWIISSMADNNSGRKDAPEQSDLDSKSSSSSVDAKGRK